MQYALVDGERVEPFSGGKGTCLMCGAKATAKCGPRVTHHWAHNRLKDCDPWWETETQWHRDWKNLFAPECREALHVASDGEIHRADVKTPTGIIIEFQHSAMSDAERISREEFYKNLVWVLDGVAFRQNFHIYHCLPDPSAEVAKDVVWAKSRRDKLGANHGLFFRLSEARKEKPEVTKAEVQSGWIHTIDEIQEEITRTYRGHHQFDWVRPRKTWLEASCPVYIDFGEELLVKLETYDDSGLKCIRYISKGKFVHDAATETSANEIGTRFYPIAEVPM